MRHRDAVADARAAESFTVDELLLQGTKVLLLDLASLGSLQQYLDEDLLLGRTGQSFDDQRRIDQFLDHAR